MFLHRIKMFWSLGTFAYYVPMLSMKQSQLKNITSIDLIFIF